MQFGIGFLRDGMQSDTFLGMPFEYNHNISIVNCLNMRELFFFFYYVKH